jgi:ABC-type bacteriocin/lantibiotic exporter with double-glycine peptidase domain
MQILLSIILLVISILLIESGQVLLGFFLIFLALFDVFGIFFAGLISILKEVFIQLKKGVYKEAEFLSKAKTKSNSGKKFFEENFKMIGKEIGKSEKAKIQNKKISSSFGIESFASMADNLLQGIGKLMKK